MTQTHKILFRTAAPSPKQSSCGARFLLISFIVFGAAVFVFPAAMAQEDVTSATDETAVTAEADQVSTTEVEQILIAESAVLSDEPDALEGVEVAEPTSVPSSFGFWWRNWRERASVALTLDPVKKAEKRLVFAEERMKLAEYIAQNSTDPKVQEKAQQMLAKADEYIQKIEDKKDDLVNSTDQRAKVLLRNVARHQVNQTLVLDKLEDKLPPEKLEQFQQFREKVEVRQENFLQNIQDNPNVPQEVKDKVSEVAARVEARVQERQEFRVEQKDLLDQIKSGNEQARTEFETLRQERQEQLQQVRQEFKEERAEIINQAKESNSGTAGDSTTTNDLKTANDLKATNELRQLIQEKTQAIQGVNQQTKDKAQQIRVELQQNTQGVKQQLQENRQELQQNIKQRIDKNNSSNTSNVSPESTSTSGQ